MTEPKRTIQTAQAGHPGKCRCGLRAAYVALTDFQARNPHGLRVLRKRVTCFCTIHGRAYAAKFRLKIQD
jgi:hypothetical protein